MKQNKKHIGKAKSQRKKTLAQYLYCLAHRRYCVFAVPWLHSLFCKHRVCHFSVWAI